MSKSNVAKDVARLLALIRENGAWYEALGKIGEDHKYEASDELLLMPDLSEEHPKAFFSICHYLESEPGSDFIARLLRLSERMTQTCPDKLAFFVRRLIRSEGHITAFRRAAKSATGRERTILLGIVQDYLHDLETQPNPLFKKHCNQLVVDLSK